MANPLSAGALAPEFSLPCTPDQKLALGSLRGRPVVLVFYPADWSPVCGDELDVFNEALPDLEKYGCTQLVGVSVDGAWCHVAYGKAHKLRFPLLADFEPKGEVARTYGVYRGSDGVCERALFVLDPGGRVEWSYVSPIAVNPGCDGVFAALDRMRQEGRLGRSPEAHATV